MIEWRIKLSGSLHFMLPHHAYRSNKFRIQHHCISPWNLQKNHNEVRKPYSIHEQLITQHNKLLALWTVDLAHRVFLMQRQVGRDMSRPCAFWSANLKINNCIYHKMSPNLKCWKPHNLSLVKGVTILKGLKYLKQLTTSLNFEINSQHPQAEVKLRTFTHA